MAAKRKFIDGIHNYCDRWCERCPMTSHCKVFALEQVHKKYADTAGHDKRNQAFWRELRELLHSSADDIRDDAREHGYDFELDFGGEDEEGSSESGFQAEPIQWKPKRPRRKPKLPTLAASAKEYMVGVSAVLKKHQKHLVDKAAVHRWLESMKPESANAHDSALVADAIEVIIWYHTLSTVKLHRALGTHAHEEEEDEVDDETQQMLDQFDRDDADGSAKVALIGIDRSIEAWAALHQKLPPLAGDALEFIHRLVDLRDRIQSSFPNARRFKRPGLDA